MGVSAKKSGKVASAQLDLRELELLGKMLDRQPERLAGKSTAVFLAESLLRVRGKDGRLHPLTANAVQREFERRRGVGNIVLKARQMGLTTWVAGRFLLKTITQPGTLTLQVAHTQQSAEEILRIVHRFVEHLPAGLRAGALKTSKASVRQIVFPAIDSEYRVVSAADRNAGRGMTVQNLHCSEVSRWTGRAADVLGGLRAGLAPNGEQVLESTPNGAEGCFYQEWERAEVTGLVKHFFPWWTEERYRSVPVAEASLTEDEMDLMGRFGLDLEQIGYRRGIQANLQGMARQEFVEDAENCFRATGEPYFDREAVAKQLKQLALEKRPVEYKKNRELTVWLPSLMGRNYVVSVDPAGGGVDGDWSAIEVLDLETGMQCAEFVTHQTGVDLAREAANLGWEYNRCPLVVERNNHGSGILWLLLYQVGYPNVYHAADGQPGWLTNSVSRPQILARMSAALVDAPELFQSRKLLVECRSFVRLRNGGVGAQNGAHDDRVMAMAIGLAARAELLGKRPSTGNAESDAARASLLLRSGGA
jgi:hypothetical protein